LGVLVLFLSPEGLGTKQPCGWDIFQERGVHGGVFSRGGVFSVQEQGLLQGVNTSHGKRTCKDKKKN